MMQISDILSILARQEAQRLRAADRLSLSMLAGDVGGLLLLYEYSQINPSYTMIADEVLDKLLITLKKPPFLSTFCNGLAGFVIALDALHRDGHIDDFSCHLQSIDHFLAHEMRAMASVNHHDFLHGIIGLGFYWLARYHQGCSEATDQLAFILRHLIKTQERDGDCIKWPQKETEMVRKYNISLSHGYSSTTILLCRMLEVPSLPADEILQLIGGATRYLQANRLDPERYGCWFASTSLECEPPHRTRLAWCYGDLGIAIALKRAGEAHHDDHLTALSRQVLKFSAQYRRNLRENYINDTSICHGASGVGLIFREMSKQFQSSTMADAADYWRDCVTRLVHQVGDEWHFPYYDAVEKKIVYRNGILEGDAGVALYLLNEIKASSLPHLLLIS